MYFFGFLISINFFLIILLFLPSITDGFGINLIKVPDEDHTQVECSMALLRKYFISGEPLSGSLLYMSLTAASVHIQKSLLKAINGMTDFPWTVVIRNPKVSKPKSFTPAEMHEKPQCYFVIIENLEDEELEDVFDDWKATLNWNPLAQFVVYLASVEETDEEMTELMIEILLNFMNKKIYNVNVIGHSEENEYYFGKTVFPYHPDNNCGNRVISIETLDVCEYQDGEKTTSDEDENENEDEGENENENANEDETEDDENENDEENKENDVNGNSAEMRNEIGEAEEKNGEDQDNGEVNEVTNNENGGVDGENRDDADDNTDRIHEDTGHDIDVGKDGKNDGNDEDQQNESAPVEHVSHDRENNHQVFSKEEKSAEDEKNKDDNENLSRNSNSEEINNDNEESGNKKIVKIDNVSNDAVIESSNIKVKRSKKRRNSNENQVTTNQQNFRSNSFYTNKRQKLESFGRKSTTQRFMRMEIDSNSEDLNNNTPNENRTEPKTYVEEIFRALFLDKFPKDLSGCPLVAAYRPWEPYIFTEASESDSDYNEADSTAESIIDIDGYNSVPNLSDEDILNSRFSGIEYKLLQTIGERLHISISIQVENKNLYHLFQQLIDGEIEMVIGGIDEDPSISQYVSTTIPYHQDDLTWCVAKATRSYYLFSFLKSFSSTVWLLLCAFVWIASLGVTFIKRILKKRLKYMHDYFIIMFRMMGILLSQSMPLGYMPSSARLIFFTAFYGGLMFLNAYQSFLISTLTTPKSAYQISRMEEIYQNRMDIMGSVENVRHLNKDGVVFKYIREKFEMCYNIEECLKQAAELDNLAVAVSRQHSFYNPRIPRNRLFCFDRNENLYVYLVTMLLPKKFHLLHKINPVIQHVIESGHMQKWARDLDMRRLIREERNRVYEEAFRSLTLNQVVGTFVFAYIFLVFATLVLFVERWVYWMSTKRRRTRIKLVKILHRRFLQT